MDGKPQDSLIGGRWREEGITQAPDYVCVWVIEDSLGSATLTTVIALHCVSQRLTGNNKQQIIANICTLSHSAERRWYCNLPRLLNKPNSVLRFWNSSVCVNRFDCLWLYTLLKTVILIYKQILYSASSKTHASVFVCTCVTAHVFTTSFNLYLESTDWKSKLQTNEDKSRIRLPQILSSRENNSDLSSSPDYIFCVCVTCVLASWRYLFKRYFLFDLFIWHTAAEDRPCQ